jgi:hypothetical protein
MFFTSETHRQRFTQVMEQIGKVYDGKLDPEYGAAIYVLTATGGTWDKAGSYVDRDGIDFETMLEEVHFSSGYRTLILLAGNLFNGNQHLDPLEFMRLDEANFKVAVTALTLRRYGGKARG